MKIIGLDPGGTTGVCTYITFESGGFPSINPMQLGAEEHHLYLYDFLMGYEPDLIICERFDYRPKQKSADLSPKEYIGVVKLYEQFRDYGNNPVEVCFQQQLKGDHGKGLWSDDKIMTIGLYQPGMPHAMDALRQILYYVTNTMNDNYWIELYGRLKD